MNEQADAQADLDIQGPADARIAQLDRILEAILLASEQPLSTEHLQRMLGRDLGVTRKDIRDGLARLSEDLEQRAAEVVEVASGWRIQVRRDYAEWVARLYQEKPPRLSRALLETLALICYRQPITRGEIEDVRGVAMSPNIIRTLLDRGWIREVGVKEVPGRPSLFGTTAQLLDDLNLHSLDDLPSLPEIKDPQQLEAALEKLGEQMHETGAHAVTAAPADDDAPADAFAGQHAGAAAADATGDDIDDVGEVDVVDEGDEDDERDEAHDDDGGDPDAPPTVH